LKSKGERGQAQSLLLVRDASSVRATRTAVRHLPDEAELGKPGRCFASVTANSTSDMNSLMMKIIPLVFGCLLILFPAFAQDDALTNQINQNGRRHSRKNAAINAQSEVTREVIISPLPTPEAPEDPTLQSRKLAAKRYPQLGDLNSGLTKTYLEIWARLIAEENPIVSHANAAERIADMAAGELKISPIE
jgi:hypothetical protein